MGNMNIFENILKYASNITINCRKQIHIGLFDWHFDAGKLDGYRENPFEYMILFVRYIIYLFTGYKDDGKLNVPWDN